MLAENEGVENLFVSDCFYNRASNNNALKSLEGRNRSKAVISTIAQPVDRQDSLMLCQQLQEQEGFDFMDQSMDLTPYLTDLRGIDESSDELEPSLEKQRMHESALQIQQCNSGSNVPQYADLTTIVETIKSEAELDDTLDEVPGSSIDIKKYGIAKEGKKCVGSRELKGADLVPIKKESSDKAEVVFTPTIKPRKYSLKPEAEKKSPLYRLKREKNNDAVRRSRSKAKQQQKMKDEQIKLLQCQVTELGKIVNEKDEQINRFGIAIREFEEEIRNLRFENMRIKNELQQVKKECNYTARITS